MDETLNSQERELLSLNQEELRHCAESNDPDVSEPAKRTLVKVADASRKLRLIRDRAHVAKALEAERKLMGEEAHSAQLMEASRQRVRSALQVLQANECPGCVDPLGDKARSCEWHLRTGKDVGVDGDACKFAHLRSSLYQEEARQDERWRRLMRAKIKDPQKLRLIPVCQRPLDVVPVLPKGMENYLAAPRAAALAVERFIDDNGRHLILYGPRGTGKTWALAALVAEVNDVYWLDAGLIRPTDEWAEERQKCIEAPVLIIPDLGTELRMSYSPAIQEIGQMICERDDQGLPVVIATNRRPTITAAEVEAQKGPPPETIQSVYGDRVWDRLSAGIVQPVIGPSIREVAQHIDWSSRSPFMLEGGKRLGERLRKPRWAA